YHDRTLTLVRSAEGARLQAPMPAAARHGGTGRVAGHAASVAHRREILAHRRRPARPRRLRMQGRPSPQYR
ncbi:MAG: hypothetical protein QJR07_00455, partial [Acetobacteraceae bacterium]|nr:hypothetical protein [Acetobacteraceae bacterium]